MTDATLRLQKLTAVNPGITEHAQLSNLVVNLFERDQAREYQSIAIFKLLYNWLQATWILSTWRDSHDNEYKGAVPIHTDEVAIWPNERKSVGSRGIMETAREASATR